MQGDAKRPEKPSRPYCPRCDDTPLRRAPRRGFLRRNLLTWLGYFPWECGLCRDEFLFKQRYQYVEQPAAPAPPAVRENVLVWQSQGSPAPAPAPAKSPEMPPPLLPGPRKFQPGVPR